MDDIISEINSIYQTVSSIPVTGDAVDVMAVVRAKLRKVHADLKEKCKEDDNT